MHCPHCGREHLNHAVFCPITGKALASGSPTCPNCGKVVHARWVRCPYCAFQLPTPPTMPAQPWWKRKYVLTLAGAGGMALVAACVLLVVALRPVDFDRFSLVAGSSARSTSEQVEEKDPPPADTADASDTALRGTFTALAVAEATVTQTPPTAATLTATRTIAPNATPSAKFTQTATSTLTQTPTPVTGVWQPCPNTYSSRLHKGDRAYVAFDPPLANRVRSGPSSSARIEGLIQPGDEVKILEDPACANNWIWWKVSAHNGNLVGWTSEGDMENYWLVPLP